MSIQVLLDKYDDGRLNVITVQKGGYESATITYIYDADKNIRQLNIERGDIPLSTIVEVLNARFIDRIGRIEDIELIKEVRLIQDKAVIDATDVDLFGNATIPNIIATAIISYSVPSGKTLIIYDWAATWLTLSQAFIAFIYNSTTTTFLATNGSDHGFQSTFTKPKRIPSGQTVQLLLVQLSGAGQAMSAHMGGLLI